MTELEHIVRFDAGYDCIRFECVNGVESCKPGAGDSHGRHGLTIRFLSKGAEGAVQFVLYTGWLPQHAAPSWIHVRDIRSWADGHDPLPVDLGYHSKRPMHEGQEPMDDACEFTGGPCYYDGSGLNAIDGMYALVNGGDKALWAFLDAYYESVFHDAPYPTPAEYRRAPRGRGTA